MDSGNATLVRLDMVILVKAKFKKHCLPKCDKYYSGTQNLRN